MKKYLIFAAAAVVAMASCSKNEILFDEATPANKIGFEVANYARQTKANALTNEEDGIYKFHTYAYQFPTIGDPQNFMDVDVLPWNVANNTRTQVTAGNDASITSWAPSDDYYWPKTGYINFYSVAGTIDPAETVSTDKKTVTLTYENKTIVDTSNVLVADAALHYSRPDANTTWNSTWKVDDSETSEHVTKGVPTLFHHQLAKLIIDVQARTTADKVSSNTIWKVQVLKTHTFDNNTIESTINPINKGSLVLTVDDSIDENTQSYPTTKAWTATNASATNISGWVPSDVATDKEKIALENSKILTIDVDNTQGYYGTNNDQIESVILESRSVMPQLTANVPFTLVYKVQALHGSTVFMEEIRTVGIDAAAAIGDLANTVTSWAANKKITYHIIIDPVSEKVTFDPAVEAYDEIDADGNVDEINIDENGIVEP